jgi:hypothetical protein
MLHFNKNASTNWYVFKVSLHRNVIIRNKWMQKKISRVRERERERERESLNV